MSGRAEWRDAEILEVLDMRERLGLSFGVIAKEMTRRRRSTVTRNTLIGMIHRINAATGKDFPDNRADGSMPPRWWAAGAEMQRLKAGTQRRGR